MRDMQNKPVEKLIHIDEKVLKPDDRIGASSPSKIMNTQQEIPSRESLQKSIVGRPRVYDLKGNLLANEENLVVLVGREYLAQLLAGRPPMDDQGNPAGSCGSPSKFDKPCNFTDYRVTYFGVGDGGTTGDCPPQTVGPYDNDIDLVNRVKIEVKVAGGQPTKDPKYIDGGKLKSIESDGAIEIMREEHTINTGKKGQQVVHAYTAIRYTMFIQPDEAPKDQGYFKFNEAGLYGVKYDSKGIPTDEHFLFARFTTLDKYLEAGDGIMIEWYILV